MGMTRLQELLDETAASIGVPGAAVAVVQDGESHVLTTGVTSVDAPVSVDESTLFMIGSTTKTVTATAVLSLAEKGVVDLDEPLVKVMPDLRLRDTRARERLTLRHLLTHGGGFEGDVADTDDWGAEAIARSVDGFDELAQHAPPGSAFSYSNSGFRLMGRVIELLTGDPYEIAAQKLVLDPLGMTESFFLPWQAFSRRHTVGHTVDNEGRPRVAHTWGLGRSGAAEGGLASSVTDQLKYLQFHLTGASTGTSPVSPSMRVEMQRHHKVAAPPFDGVGMPWLLVDMFGTTAVTHGGNIAGIQRSMFTMLPEEGFGVTVLANSGAGGALGTAVTSWCFEHLLGRTANPSHEALMLSDAELEPFAGTWDSGSWGMTLAPENGSLTATFFLSNPDRDEERHLPPPMPLALCAPDEIIHPGAPESLFGRFIRDSDGEVTGLLAQGRALRRVKRGGETS